MPDAGSIGKIGRPEEVDKASGTTSQTCGVDRSEGDRE